MVVIGITGGYASGKSVVTRILQDFGAFVVDADETAREVLSVGTPAWRQVKEAFGEDVFDSEGIVDRKRLGRIVFSDEARLRELERITHPHIIKIIKEKLQGAMNSGYDLIVLDAPLLIETGLTSLVDYVWVVYAPEDLQIRRAMVRDGLTRDEAVSRIHSQMDLKEKVKYADVVINNDGTLEDTRRQVLRALEKVLGPGANS
ncbi:MAG TPA: dephospho-CoA kinase [Clostridia bacterium]|nr:dephospho-CoA kinase [Clostridia bacterium]